MRTSETPRPSSRSRSCATYALATSGAFSPVPEDRLGDDLDQRDAGAVVVDQRVVGAVDPAGGAADVQRLAGVLLHVRALDLDRGRSRRRPRRLGPAVERDRLVVLRGLEVLRHVRVEVVLPREPAPLGDLAVERQPDPDRRLDGLAVDDRHRAGQAEAGRADLGVGLGAELGRAAAEHLRRGVQLDVDLEAQRRVELLQRVLEGHQGVGHAQLSTASQGRAPGRAAARPTASASSASSAAPTR